MGWGLANPYSCDLDNLFLEGPTKLETCEVDVASCQGPQWGVCVCVCVCVCERARVVHSVGSLSKDLTLSLWNRLSMQY